MENNILNDLRTPVFLVNKSKIYDLGCSTGKLLRDISDYNKDLDIKLCGLDAEAKMIQHSKKLLNKNSKKRISFKKSDLLNLKLQKSDFITSYYTIQFVKPKFRQKIFDKIYKSLNHGGAFVLFEKVRGPDARFQDIFNQIYHEFKFDKGFSKEQIYNKATSIRGVLEPFTSKANIDYMKRAGFEDITPILKYCNFEGFLERKRRHVGTKIGSKIDANFERRFFEKTWFYFSENHYFEGSGGRS